MPSKPIIYTQHARDRMQDPNRGLISEAEVEDVLVSPTASYLGIDGKLNVLGESGGKRIRVFYIEETVRLLIRMVINRGVE